METSKLLNSAPASLAVNRLIAVDFRKVVCVFELKNGTLEGGSLRHGNANYHGLAPPGRRTTCNLHSITSRFLP